MFEFYKDCTFEMQSSFNWIPIIFQFFTLCIASIALYIASKNLTGVIRTQAIQAHINLISLQNEVSKNIANRAIVTYRRSKAIEPDRMEELGVEENSAYILYFTSVDKLASLINTEYLPKQFPDNKGKIDREKWKNEYYHIFEDARNAANVYDGVISGKSQMIQNLIILLDIWDKENELKTPITNTLPNS
jgi:hypothetical protein